MTIDSTLNKYYSVPCLTEDKKQNKTKTKNQGLFIEVISVTTIFRGTHLIIRRLRMVA